MTVAHHDSQPGKVARMTSIRPYPPDWPKRLKSQDQPIQIRLVSRPKNADLRRDLYQALLHLRIPAGLAAMRHIKGLRSRTWAMGGIETATQFQETPHHD